MKKRSKIFIFIAIAAILVYGGYAFLKPYYDIWRLAEGWDDFQEAIEDYLQNDRYGGATPEETYNFYLAALKSGDLEAASKYFYWEKQVEQKERLEELKAKGELEKYIADLPEWGEMKEEEYWDKNGRRYIITKTSDKPEIILLPDGQGDLKEISFPAGDYVSFSIELKMNQKANIWKIYSL